MNNISLPHTHTHTLSRTHDLIFRNLKNVKSGVVKQLNGFIFDAIYVASIFIL